jgi:hypothetical protein
MFWQNVLVADVTKFWAMYATVSWPRVPHALTPGRVWRIKGAVKRSVLAMVDDSLNY